MLGFVLFCFVLRSIDPVVIFLNGSADAARHFACGSRLSGLDKMGRFIKGAKVHHVVVSVHGDEGLLEPVG